MADVTGANTTFHPVVSQNTESVLRHRARFQTSSGSKINLPLVTGLRYIIYSAYTAGKTFTIGISTDGTNYLSGKTYFNFAQAAGPVDLAKFFSSTPFTQYTPPTATDVYLLVETDAGEFTISIVEFKV